MRLIKKPGHIIPSKSQQSGFTLVEIAIVLVIIGLLLGGVLKGAELVENAKVRKAVNEFNGTTAAYYSYQDRYSRVPGDDGRTLAALQARGGNWANLTASSVGNRDGILYAREGWTFVGAGEGDAFWNQLRAAGFVNGDLTLTAREALPNNTFGGLMGITSSSINNNLNGLKICMSQVPGKHAVSLDSQLDDGNGATGKMRGTLSVAGANTAPSTNALAAAYNEENIYTLCLQI